MSIKIPRPIILIIRELCDIGEYTKALNLLCTVPRKDKQNITDFPTHYGWACGSIVDETTAGAEIQNRVALKEQQNIKLIELLTHQKEFDGDELQKKFRVLLKTDDYRKIIENKEKEDPTVSNLDIINGLFRVYYYTEIMLKSKIVGQIEQIKEEILSDVLDEMADIRYLRFPKNTNINIGALFEQKRNAEIILERTFKIRYPDGPNLPQSIVEEYCDL